MSFSASLTQLVEKSDSPLVSAASTWPRIPLGQLVEIQNGAPWKSKYFNEKNGVPLIRIRDVTTGSTDTYYSGPIDDNYWIEPGDILIGMDGDFNIRVWNSDRGLLNQRVCKITPDERYLLRGYLVHILPGYLQLINEETHSVTVKHLSSRTIGEIPIPLPSLPEQYRIVAKLDSLCARSVRARQELDRVPILLKRYKQSLLNETFLNADGAKQIAIGDLIADGPQNGLYLPKSHYGAGTPILRIENYGFEGTEPIAMWSRVKIESGIATKYSLTPGDIVINRVNSPSHLGKSLLVLDIHTPAVFESNMMRMRVSDKVQPEYLQLFLGSELGRRRLIADAKWAVNQASINQGDVCKTAVPVPSLSTQSKMIAEIRAAIIWLDKIAAEHDRVEHLLPKLDQAILAKAFRGELVPEDPNDGAASVLIERIRVQQESRLGTKRRSVRRN